MPCHLRNAKKKKSTSPSLNKQNSNNNNKNKQASCQGVNTLFFLLDAAFSL